MTRSERLLYHQIHPLKLLTDFGTSFASTWLVWEQRWALAALIAFVPSIIASLLLVGWAELEPYRRTPLGRYLRRHMTPAVQAVRLLGQAVMWSGAAVHIPWLIRTFGPNADSVTALAVLLSSQRR
jgi:hypothetical protein